MNRRNRFAALSLFAISLALSGFAHITGEAGRAPTLPPRTPGLERPFPQDEDKFTFAVIGDKTGGGERNWPIFDRAMDEVSEIHPDFAIMVGDLIQGYTEDVDQLDREWEEFLGHASRMEIPFFFLPGNHDISNKTMYDFWNANVGRTYYSFTYKNCHFVLLNTEEGWRNDEETFGAEQLAWIKEDIDANRDAKRFFVMMHKPVWYHSGESLEQWLQVEEWLKGTRYTVFAGHWHQLIYDTRVERPYYVLSATGGGLTPSEVEEYGSFHHYTTVTVDGSNTRIAIIRPGNVFPHDIAPREFREKANRLLNWSVRAPTDAAPKGEVRLTAANPFDKPVSVEVTLSAGDDSRWSVEPATVSLEIGPGERGEVAFTVEGRSTEAESYPEYTATVEYGGERLYRRSGTLEPPETE